MASYILLTDSSCDLPQELADSLEIQAVPLHVQYRGREYANYLDGRELDIRELYASLRNGEVTRTTAVNPEEWSGAMRPHLEAGEDLLILAFSSGLSNTYNAARIAAEELAPEYPQRKMVVVDTLCASLGQGLLCWLTARERLAGKTLEEAAAFAEETKLHICHWFTVGDLHFLKRGGRISAATAAVGSLLQIKPVMHVDNAGHLVPVSKARGRKASLAALVEEMKKTAVDLKDQTVFISHGDCQEEVEAMARTIRQELGVKDVIVNFVGPVIGSHSGPGTVALFFVGTHR